MKYIRLSFDKLTIHFDRDYGYDKRTGWSSEMNGSYIVELEPCLLRMIWLTMREVWRPIK